jgi:hypothetical protein
MSFPVETGIRDTACENKNHIKEWIPAFAGMTIRLNLYDFNFDIWISISFAVQQKCYRPIIDQMNLHLRLKFSCLDCDALVSQS